MNAPMSQSPRFALNSLRLPVFLCAAALLGATFGSGFAHAGAPAEPTPQPVPCQAKVIHTKAVRKACDDGGQKAVKKLMKDLVKKSKAAGKPVKCKECHEDMKKFTYDDDGLAQLRTMLGESAPSKGKGKGKKKQRKKGK